MQFFLTRTAVLKAQQKSPTLAKLSTLDVATWLLASLETAKQVEPAIAAANLSLAEFCKAHNLGLSTSAVSRLTNAEGLPKLDVAAALEDKLQIPIRSWLIQA